MSDLISRQAAIDAVMKYCLQYDLRDLLAELEVMPSAQRWIPCSERLPEIGQSVLLSVGGMYSAEGCLREDGDWAQFRWDAIQRKDMVGAWKPLPEPYKEEQE